MARLTIVGLGSGGEGALTAAARQALEKSKHILVPWRPEATPEWFAALCAQVRSIANVPTESQAAEQTAIALANNSIEAAVRHEMVVYAVPGHPHEAPEFAQLVSEAERRHVQIEVEPGLGSRDWIPNLLKVGVLSRVSVAPPTHLESLDTASHALVGPVYDEQWMAATALELGESYPGNHAMLWIPWGHGSGETIEATVAAGATLETRGQPGWLYLPPLAEGGARDAVGVFESIVARLRAPMGCPWDREQSHNSIKKNLLEEAYEALDALDAEDPHKMREELGDLLLQVVLHAQMATEAGTFTLDEVARGISRKLVRRHPHIFGDVEASTASQVVRNWEAIKRTERGEEKSMLSSVPRQLPALARAQAIQERVSRVGFDWPDISGVQEKIAEEARELASAETNAERQSELGDLLFSLVNYARWLHLDSEEALRIANHRFAERFAFMERNARERGLQIEDLTPAQQDEIWNLAKADARQTE